MKTIEERIEEIATKHFPFGKAAFYPCRDALRELAADLNAEKEKEVAAAKSSRRVIIDMLRCDIESKAKEIAGLQAWKESALKVMPDFPKLGKLLGLPLGSDVSEQLVPAVEKLTKEVAELRQELAMATDAANKGDKARLKAGAMEDMIADQTTLLDEVKSALEYANQLAKQISGDGRGHARFDQLLTRLHDTK